MPIEVTTVQAYNTFGVTRATARWLAERVPAPVRYRDDEQEDWASRKRALIAGEIAVGWLCGAHYVEALAQGNACCELLAAPVPAPVRYGGQPRYFSDVVVRANDPARAFADLEGRRFAFNERSSQSGYNVMLAELSRRGRPAGFFAEAIEAGAHVNAIDTVLDGRADVAAIDSTVLEAERERRPAAVARLRVLTTLGPSPVPPWVVSTALPGATRVRLREALLAMHEDSEGRAILEAGGLSRFTATEDRRYAEVGAVAAAARTVSPT